MSSKLKAILWVMSLLTVVYVSQQYRVAQQARASAQTQHTTFSTKPSPLFKVTQIGGQVMRINETTGETHYWNNESGGWVKINETSLVTAVSEAERNARKAVIQTWYNTIEPELKKDISYETWEGTLVETPSWQIQDSFDKWQREQTQAKQQAEQERRKPLIQSWYKQLTPQEQEATPYGQFETSLLDETADISGRQKVIRSWYDIMDSTYKQKVPFERFEAVEIQQHIVNLQEALNKQSRTALPLKPSSKDRFCPVGGESYSADVKFCPKHGVETRIPSSN